MRPLLHAAMALPLALACCGASGEVYTYVDPVSGMTILSNVASAKRGASATPATRGTHGRPASGTAPVSFPRISTEKQKQLDGGRRDILVAELNTEQQALATATARRAAEDTVRRHLANVNALKRELAGLRL